MKIISIATKVLHYFPEEVSHFLALKGLKIAFNAGILQFLVDNKKNLVSAELPNETCKNLAKLKNLRSRLGIAAGLDKDGEYIDCLAALGVGFIEVGTVTPRPQPGNDKPRIFRNNKDRSILNRLGFNNKGVDALVTRLKKKKSNIPVGVSIGKNFDTPLEKAQDDYLICMEKVYRYSDYLAINISSPNTKNLRDLSSQDYLNNLLGELKKLQKKLSKKHGYRPLYLKISPDETIGAIENICNSILHNNLDGIICSNTTIQHNDKNGKGGISGLPLFKKSTECLKKVKEIVGEEVLIIASGGVMSAQDFQEKLSSGADLVQIYTGFIFEGPELVQNILKHEAS